VSYFRDTYNRNEKTNGVIIDIALDDQLNFYHEWDNVKFKNRDVNPDLADFLENYVKQIPSKENLEIKFYINNNRDSDAEYGIIESFKHYYGMEIRAVKKDMLYMYMFTVANFMLFLLLNSVYFYVGENFGDGLVAYTLEIGFELGLWIFMWQAFYTIVFDRTGEKRKMKLYRRLLNAEISFAGEFK